MKHVISQQITLIMCHLLFQALLREARLSVLCPCPSAIVSCRLATKSFQRMKASGEDGEDDGTEMQRVQGL